MLEGLAAWVLNNYLGKYVENLNTDQLSVALLSGKVELENLPLKRDALRHLGLPIEIKTGFIGKIKLQVPVRQVRSAPWTILIEQVYLVASPLSVDDWDTEAELIALQETKLSALDALEARWRYETDMINNSSGGTASMSSGTTPNIGNDGQQYYYATSYTSWLSFGAGIVSDIIENLQLQIHDVHIRYEDNNNNNSEISTAFGLTMASLSAQSCDSNWTPGFFHWTKDQLSFKMMDMQKLAIYWTVAGPHCQMSNLNPADLAVAMAPNKSIENFGKFYILSPVSARAHVTRNRSEHALKSSSTPRFACDLLLDEVPLTLIDWQYDQMVRCMRTLNDIERMRAYRRYKPQCSITEDARAWWLYAISCLYPGNKQPNLCRPRPTWSDALERARQNVRYVQIYRKILVAPLTTACLNNEEKDLKNIVEWSREFDELRVLRELAVRTVNLPPAPPPINNQAPNVGRSVLLSWFPQWMGWYSPPPPQTPLEGEILQALSDSVESDNTIFKRDTVFGRFQFTLERGCLTLCAGHQFTREGAPMIELEFKNLSLMIISRPRTNSHLIELSLGALYLKDRITLNTIFPILVGPPGQDRATTLPTTRLQQYSAPLQKTDPIETDLFYLAYEKKPPTSTCDFRLCIRSRCLDVVYQPNAVNWLTDFLCLPHQRDVTHFRIEAVKFRTKKELIRNWEHLLDGSRTYTTTVTARNKWHLELDIAAPQIIFVEQFTNQNSAMAVIDFGRFQLRNATKMTQPTIAPPDDDNTDDEDEMFATPCSTPPQSNSNSDSISNGDLSSRTDNNVGIDQMLHSKLYDSYHVEMTDLQILIGRIKDNWRYARNRASSTLHVLDRFNISVQMERRVIRTTDPNFPSLTLSATLPKLVAHLNESKINAARNLAHIISTVGLPSPFRSPDSGELFVTDDQDNDQEASIASLDSNSVEMSRVVMMQFLVDNLSLEVQSRGRCVAELQVSGVRAAFSKRQIDNSITLSVHSLLLVDALQTFGPDFELLAASHKHVGMDSISGSLRDSEPTSPTPQSPSSPDPACGAVCRPSSTSPVALSQALNTLVDAEALITVEVVLISGPEPLQIANIQFNNLDIIANQETIVELVGFVQRVMPGKAQTHPNLKSSVYQENRTSMESLVVPSDGLEPKICTTELTFDFHRLNVLLLRGVMMKDGAMYGKKICTSTISEARIQATVSDSIIIEGSLGGLQVLDLTPEGQMHQRIVSVGCDPFQDDLKTLYTMSSGDLSGLLSGVNGRKAFNFKICRRLDDDDTADVSVRMASLWYTHSPQLIVELQSCASEFKQYLANLARSIRHAATDVALGLVHAKAEALAQSLYMNARLSSSIYGDVTSSSFGTSSFVMSSPRRRRRSGNYETGTPSGVSSLNYTVPQTPYGGQEDDIEDNIIKLNLDIVLDSPVVVVPQSFNSTKVFVAHLGKITVDNKPVDGAFSYNEENCEYYTVEVRDMNLFSVDTKGRRPKGTMICKSEILYSTKSSANPIVHDTILLLKIERQINDKTKTSSRHLNDSMPLLFDSDVNVTSDVNEDKPNENISINVSVVNDLKLSLSRAQYQQILETFEWLTSSSIKTTVGSSLTSTSTVTSVKTDSFLADISEEDTGVTTLNMDPRVRAKLFPSINTLEKSKVINQSLIFFKLFFKLPTFTIGLRGDSPTGERALVDLSFGDLNFMYEKCHRYETNIQVALRSIYMEDLLQAKDSHHRVMVNSYCRTPSYTESHGNLSKPSLSRSCPNLVTNNNIGFGYSLTAVHNYGSLPDHLESAHLFGAIYTNSRKMSTKKRRILQPNTPPSSPTATCREQPNLVLISTVLIDPDAPNFASKYNSIKRSTSVDFNCLDLVVSVESWVVVIDFFSANQQPPLQSKTTTPIPTTPSTKPSDVCQIDTSQTFITVKSLNIVLVRRDLDLAKANISNTEISIRSDGELKSVSGTLGSLSLVDLTRHGQLYRERFFTAQTDGGALLKFTYTRAVLHQTPSDDINCDAQLTIDMSSVIYVHTKRFVAELQAFFKHFSQLQAVMYKIRAATSGQNINNDEPLKLSLSLTVDASMILLPVSSTSFDMLTVDLGNLTLRNEFVAVATECRAQHSKNVKKCILDVMSIQLSNIDMYTAFRENNTNFLTRDIQRCGASLLQKKFELTLQVERHLNSVNCHCTPDITISGCLSTLDISLQLSQYRLIRGLLAYNLGEDTERILPSVTPSINPNVNLKDDWTLSLLKLDLQDVKLSLSNDDDTVPLTCVNFIKSRLTIENFSNFCQDVDLLSQEILILDTRYDLQVENCRPNVFRDILQPIKRQFDNTSNVQVEVHSRKRQNHAKFTILLNDIRLMAIFDWWSAFKTYIFQEFETVAPPIEPIPPSTISSATTYEIKLNITDSEIVVVEDTSHWSTNAIIVKSTTVITYRPATVDKPLSCSLNNCEMFSCVVGREAETALSIIDPLTLSAELNCDGILDVHVNVVTVRLSYNDMCMFSQMLESVPRQFRDSTIIGSSTTNIGNKDLEEQVQIAKLMQLGFHYDDCVRAVNECESRIDDAALWLTHNATPVMGTAVQEQIQKSASINIQQIDIRANYASLCIIDDCGDSDMPLLDLTLSHMKITQFLSSTQNAEMEHHQFSGSLDCILAGDYYNRVLSGWEPSIEPWKCRILWERTVQNLKSRLNIRFESSDVLNVNITSTLIELSKQVRQNWLRDYYNNKNAQQRMRSTTTTRSPFVPFAIRNDTGVALSFTTQVTEIERNKHTSSTGSGAVDNWTLVPDNVTVPFTFTNRSSKIRHRRDVHKMRTHQIRVQIGQWSTISTPISIDKVGVYFRTLDRTLGTRVIFDIVQDGPARKLITVRSSVQIVNGLDQPIELKLEWQQQAGPAWHSTKIFTVTNRQIWSVPLTYAKSLISGRPTGFNNTTYTYSNPLLAPPTLLATTLYELRQCQSHRGDIYRFYVKTSIDTSESDDVKQPAHTITLLPAIRLINLLPLDVNYTISTEFGVIPAGSQVLITSIDPNDETVDLLFSFENFTPLNRVSIPTSTTGGNKKIPILLEDGQERKLYLWVEFGMNFGAKIRITLSAHYWIINKTGLPLVFRQAGAAAECAGQFGEHERARMVTPFLFSFSDTDASHTINARVGRYVISGGSPRWSSNFDVRKNIQVKKLHVTMGGGRPDTVFVVGVEVRPGRGKYRSTTMITVSPRYTLYNQSSYRLLFAQSCFTDRLPSSQPDTCLKAMPNCHMSFHWPRLDKDQLLCVSIADIPDCCWSGGLQIDETNSLHVNIRDVNGTVYFLRMEVQLQITTFIIVFTDADTLPPPIRVDNFSEVTLRFAQLSNDNSTSTADVVSSVARAHSRVPYAWDQPIQRHLLVVTAPGGTSNTYNLNNLGAAPHLTYENYIYIAFGGTFKHTGGGTNGFDVERQELVLDVNCDQSHLVVLAGKRQGERSQLWQLTAEGRLQHEGSSPPTAPNQPRNYDNVLVLDIEGTAPQPNKCSRLVVRRIDPRRRSTQTWRFTAEGRLCCAHYNMCAQTQDGVFGLYKGNTVVLGLAQSPHHYQTSIPIEQLITYQKLRPGSGILDVSVEMDGPTSVLTVRDKNEAENTALFDRNEYFMNIDNSGPHHEYQITANLCGLGISLVYCCKSTASEELLYVLMSNIVGEITTMTSGQQFCISVGQIQIDNQLLDSVTAVTLYVTPPRNYSDEVTHKLPAIDFTAEIQRTLNENAVIFKHLILKLNRITIVLEEKLLLKFIDFIGLHTPEEELLISQADESDFEVRRFVVEVSKAHAKRYYFGVLQLIPDQIHLSMKTTAKLPMELIQIKRKLGMTLVTFEDAAVDLHGFDRRHLFETGQFLGTSIVEHFKRELMWQAGIILGSVDFLGNPLGLMNDVSEGFSGLLFEGNVGALFKNVTHGISNSAVKVTETISDGLGRATLDDVHEEVRQKIRRVDSGKSSDHIMAGFKGLGYGLWSGATGIFTQVYQGANTDGLAGAVVGVGKGLLGVVTKPVVGVLDFASETARAVRDSSKSKSEPVRMRLSRCVNSYGGLLPRYSAKQSQGQQYLYLVNDKDYKEHFITYEILGSPIENLHCLISNLKIRIIAVTTESPELTSIVECHLRDLVGCNVIADKVASDDERYYIEIVSHVTYVSGTSQLSATVASSTPSVNLMATTGDNAIEPVKKPRVRCKSLQVATSVAEQINYAKRLYVERLTTVTITDNINTTNNHLED